MVAFQSKSLSTRNSPFPVMPNGLTLDRSDEERDELKDARDHHEKPYIRERATALPKIADGQSGRYGLRCSDLT